IPQPRDSLLAGLWQVLQNRKTWINGAVIGFLYAPTAAFAELWGASYLERVYTIKPEVAASAISMIFIGWAIGGPLAGLFSDFIRRRKPILMGSIILSLLFMSSVLYLPNLPVALVFVLLFCYGFSNVGVAICYAVACEINPKKRAGTSMSFANMASVLIGAGFQPIIGWLLDLQWNHKLVAGVPFYSAHDFRVAMLALPACFIVSLIACLRLRESYNR
ncbi:MAG: MFS transporter, partial [Gammaproteobacteria bacterium]|nr:MFS transporter [Gammaproteobacteria bacterium]